MFVRVGTSVDTSERKSLKIPSRLNVVSSALTLLVTFAAIPNSFLLKLSKPSRVRLLEQVPAMPAAYAVSMRVMSLTNGMLREVRTVETLDSFAMTSTRVFATSTNRLVGRMLMTDDPIMLLWSPVKW